MSYSFQISFHKGYNLGQNNMKLKAPHSESRMELRDEQNEPLSHTCFFLGVGGGRG